MTSRGTASTRPFRALMVGALATAMVGSGFVAKAALADQKPERVLQSVSVDLGADGSLYGIKGVTVRKVAGEKPTSDQVDYDAKKTSGQLPIRVLTSYRAGNRTGTDLSDLKGYDGRVQVDVTVQNTTVRPQKLTYDSDGTSRSAYALVGVPLTVVASSKLGKDTVDRVVTRSDTGDSTTNGVLSQDKSGNGIVQWASILAPPQLAPSTTFTLVMDAKDFSLPSLDLSVQPGIATDASLRTLMNQAFGQQGNSELAMQGDTIKLVTQVTGVLADAGDQLVEVRKQLKFSAGTLGDQTISDLSAGTARLSSSTQALATSLQALGTSLGSSLDSSRSETLAALKDSVDKVSALLGDPAAAVPAPVLAGSGCAQQVRKTMKPAGSVYAQLNQVVSLLDGLSTTTGGCRRAISQSLVDTIGTVDANGGVCPPGDVSAICAIEQARTKLSAVSANLGTTLTAASSAISKLDVDPALTQVDALTTTVRGLQAKTATLKAGGSSDDLAALQRAVQSLVDANVGGLQGQLDAMHLVATNNLAALGSPQDDVTATSMYGKLAALRQGVADLQTTYTIPDEDTQGIRDLADGLGTGLDDQVAGWKQVEAATDPTSAGYKAVGFVARGLFTLQSTIIELIKGPSSDLNRTIREVKDAAASLYAVPSAGGPGPVLPDCTNYTTITNTDPVTRTQLAFLTVKCQRDAVQASLDGVTQRGTTDITAASQKVEDQVKVIDARRVASDTALTTLFDQASSGLTDAGKTIQTDGRRSVRSANGALDGAEGNVDATLTQVVTSSLHSIDQSVTSSTRDLQSAGDLLAQDLTNVLKDLGSKDKAGTGLLGIVQAQAAQTRTSSAHLAAAGSQASSFGNVRTQDLDGIFLRSAQLQAALARQAAMPAFAMNLPNGSQHVSVYSFHLREVK